MIYRATRDSIGFMGRRWKEGELTPDITESELLDDPALKHFEPVKGNAVDSDEDPEKNLTTKQLAIQQTLETMTIPQLRQYAAEHGIDLPAKATKEEILKLLDQ